MDSYQAPLSWDSPGMNTRVGCHFFLQGIFLNQGSNLCLLHCQVDSLPLSHLGSPCCAWSLSRVQLFVTPWTVACQAPLSMGILHGQEYCPWTVFSMDKNTGVGCHAFLQCIFPTQGSNPGLPHCKWILLLFDTKTEGRPGLSSEIKGNTEQ